MSDVLHEAGERPTGWRRVVLSVVYLLSLCAMLPSVGALAAGWWWAADLCCHFRVQYVIVLLPFVLIYAKLREWKWCAVVALVFGLNLALISPLLLPRSPVSSDDNSLKLTTANVYVGNRDSRLFLELIGREQPDVFLVLEINDWWMAELESLREEYPHRIDSVSDPEYPQYGAFGCALLSRIPIQDARITRIGRHHLPVVFAEVEHAGSRVTICGAHPLPPAGRERTANRDEYLTELGRMLLKIDTPLILLGDLNTTRWSPVFGRLTAAASLRDASEGFGFQPTWPDWLPVPLIPIDHVLVSREFDVIDHSVGPAIGSDHRPITVEVVISSSAAAPTPK